MCTALKTLFSRSGLSAISMSGQACASLELGGGCSRSAFAPEWRESRVCVTQGGVICCNNAVRLLSVVFSGGKSHPDCSARMKTGSCCTCTDSAHNAVCHVHSAFPLSKVFCIVQSRSTAMLFSCSSSHPELLLSVSILSRCRIFLRLEAFLPRLFFYDDDDCYYYYH